MKRFAERFAIAAIYLAVGLWLGYGYGKHSADHWWHTKCDIAPLHIDYVPAGIGKPPSVVASCGKDSILYDGKCWPQPKFHIDVVRDCIPGEDSFRKQDCLNKMSADTIWNLDKTIELNNETARILDGIFPHPPLAHPLKLGKRKPAPCDIKECSPESTKLCGCAPTPISSGVPTTVEPTWNDNAHWYQYPLPPYWTCPAGYEQVTLDARFSASAPGEMASGSEDHAHKPKCELPSGAFGVPTPQVPQ